MIFLCGHYEGIDERVLEEIVTDYVSIGDYVLTGGELPAMVMIDAISRLIPGVLHNDVSAEFESFQDNLLEYPQYTRPEEWHGKKVPEILLSGHHANVEKWRREQSIIRTAERRPDLLEKVFEKVRQARPARLFLACDGPRKDRPEDIEKINQCKAIVEKIDWDCEVHRKYAEENMGCGVCPYSAIGWAFSMTEKLVILEDDCVPHDSFFPYMDKIIERWHQQGINNRKDAEDDNQKYKKKSNQNGKMFMIKLVQMKLVLVIILVLL